MQDRPDDGTESTTSDTSRSSVAADGAGSPDSDSPAHDATALVASLCSRLPAHTQVVLCTPLLDDVPVTVVERLLAAHHEVTVVSPNVTNLPGRDPSPGQATRDLARRTRLTDLERLGVPATDWRPEDPLGVALAHVLETRPGGWRR